MPKFIEVTELCYDKKQLINIDNIVLVDDNQIIVSDGKNGHYIRCHEDYSQIIAKIKSKVER